MNALMRDSGAEGFGSLALGVEGCCGLHCSTAAAGLQVATEGEAERALAALADCTGAMRAGV